MRHTEEWRRSDCTEVTHGRIGDLPMIDQSRKSTPLRIAALITCHNRREKTLSCLQSVCEQELPGGLTIQIYLLDDGSTDGTSEAVAKRFPEVRLLKGDGSLFWCGGMRVAWTEAMRDDYDAYLWLNDDSVLLPGAIRCLWQTSLDGCRLTGRDGVVVGSCRDPQTDEHTYGGRVKRKSGSRLPSIPVPPRNEMLPCDTMNGNIVLVTRAAFHVLGNLSAEYTHTFGDVDYGMRARRQGVPVWIASGYQGQCAANTRIRPWIDPGVPLRQRWRHMCSPLGLPPKEWLAYVRHHTGWQWPPYFMKPLVRVLVPSLWTWRAARARTRRTAGRVM